MKKICFINGSPKKSVSCSGTLINEISKMLDSSKVQTEAVSIVNCLKSDGLEKTFAKLLQMDVLVFVFPLYIDSIPSSMLDFLDQFNVFVDSQTERKAVKTLGPKVYAIMNCGFIEGMHNRTALKIMEHFSNALGFNWRFGMGIGAGEFMRATFTVIPLQSKLKRTVYQALCKLKDDIEGEEAIYEKNLLVNPAMSKLVFIVVGYWNWITMAKKAGLKRRALYNRPYGVKS